MEKIIYFIVSLLLLVSCTNKDTYCKYYCKDADFTFSMLYEYEKANRNVLIFGDKDSIFNILGKDGQNCGLLFCLSENKDTIYVMHNDTERPIPRFVENRYHFKFFKIKYVPWVGYDYDSSIGNCNYWVFSGHCDQGSYTFNYSKSHSDKKYPYLEPLEWK